MGGKEEGRKGSKEGSKKIHSIRNYQKKQESNKIHYEETFHQRIFNLEVLKYVFTRKFH